MQTSIGLPTDIAIRFGKEWITSLTQDFDELTRADILLVFSELLSNAVKATDRVSKNETIWICFSTCGERVVLLVQDNGKGFTKEMELFKPDYYLKRKPVDPMKQSGRGILIAKENCSRLTYRRHNNGWIAKAEWGIDAGGDECVWQ